KPAATAEPGGGRASRPGAAPHGAEVQSGGNGKGRDGAGRPTRVRRPTGPGFKPAATGERGRGGGHRPGRRARQGAVSYMPGSTGAGRGLRASPSPQMTSTSE